MGSFVVDVGAVNEFMRSQDGPVMRRMLVVGDAVKAAARAQLKAGFPADFIGPQIVKRMEVVGSGPQAGPHVYVGVAKTRTRAHAIEGKPLLVFFWKKAGRVVFLRHVNHPGSDFTAYIDRVLLRALEAARGAL